MPIYEFHCTNCNSDHELLLKIGEHPPCPRCEEATLEKRLSSVHGRTGGAGCEVGGACEPGGPGCAGSKPKPEAHVHSGGCCQVRADSLVKKYLD